MSHLKSPEEVKGDKRKLVIQDEEVLQVLQDIRSELQKLNVHMTLINDLHIEDSDFG